MRNPAFAINYQLLRYSNKQWVNTTNAQLLLPYCITHTTRMDLITDDGDNTSQQDNLTGVTYEFIIKYKRDRSLWQSWWTCLNYASKLSIAYATKVKVSCTFQTKANWFFLVREQLTKTPWWYLHGHVQLINVYYCRAYGHTEEGSAKSPSLRNRTEDITW